MSDVAVLLDKAKNTLKASSDAEFARHLGELMKPTCPVSAQVVRLPARERFDGQA